MARLFSFLQTELSSAVASSFNTGNHRAVVVGSILRDLSGLIRRPLLAFGAIRRLLLAALAILRVHENLTRHRSAWTRASILLRDASVLLGGTCVSRGRTPYVS
jgi:hypothetical protein